MSSEEFKSLLILMILTPGGNFLLCLVISDSNLDVTGFLQWQFGGPYFRETIQLPLSETRRCCQPWAL